MNLQTNESKSAIIPTIVQTISFEFKKKLLSKLQGTDQATNDNRLEGHGVILNVCNKKKSLGKK